MRSWLKPSGVVPIKDTDAAWLAGFFDGEGSLCCYLGGRNREYRSWFISVPNTNKDSLLRCQKITGVGAILTKRRNKPHHKQSWVWRVNAQRDILAIMRALLPHLTIKKKKAAEYLNAFVDVELQ